MLTGGKLAAVSKTCREQTKSRVCRFGAQPSGTLAGDRPTAMMEGAEGDPPWQRPARGRRLRAVGACLSSI